MSKNLNVSILLQVLQMKTVLKHLNIGDKNITSLTNKTTLISIRYLKNLSLAVQRV